MSTQANGCRRSESFFSRYHAGLVRQERSAPVDPLENTPPSPSSGLCRPFLTDADKDAHRRLFDRKC